MLTIRQTALKDYEMCPYMFKEFWGEVGVDKYDEDDKNLQNKYSATGTALHETLEYWGNSWILDNHRETLDELHRILENKMNLIPIELFDNPYDFELMKNNIHQQLDWLDEKILMLRPIAVERKFLVENLIKGIDMPFSGTIDRIDGRPGNITLIDYKSGKPYTKKELASNIQATIYCLSYQRIYGELPKQFIFYFSNLKKIKEIEVTDEFLYDGITRIKSIWLHILNEDFKVPVKPNKFFCSNFCKVNECISKGKGNWKKVGYEVFNPYNNL